jgi:acyl carrier protein
MPITPSDIEIIRAEVARLARVELARVSDDTDFVSELGMGSLELLNLLAFVEQRMKVILPDESLVKLTSIELIRAKFEVFIHDGGKI